MKRRVVVTGMGTVNPLAKNVKDTWEAIKKGECGIAPTTLIDIEKYPSKVAAEVKNWNAADYIDKRAARQMARFTQFACVAAKEAMDDAGLKEGNFDPFRSGVIMGNGIGGFEIIEEGYKQIFSDKNVAPMTIPKLILNEGPANVAIQHGLKGPCYAVVTACAAGTDAIGNALMSIRSGQTDMVITGGMEAPISMMAVDGFCKIQALTTNNDPKTACRPFDKDRDGFIIGEGAGVLILEELEHAKARGAKIYAELAGYGQTCDAGHITAPAPDGEGGARSMILALKDAGMEPEEIQYINAHGTSTPTNDPIETMAIKTAFGEHAYKLKVSSTKGMTGHCVGAAGGIEAIISVLAINDGFYPATVGLVNEDEGCDLDYVKGKGVEGEINAALSDSLGFGGHNGSLIFKKYKD
jgi:3-oxoacyl-[acyl-carrier-protein] synthase II